MENPDGTTRNVDGGDLPDEQDDRVVSVGDPNQTGERKKNAVLGLREKRVKDSERTTTPYMTKYERARVLGTRALQIR